MTKIVGVRIRACELEIIDLAARETGISRSELMRRGAERVAQEILSGCEAPAEAEGSR